MNAQLHLSALLGIDIGGVNTRTCLFGVSEGKYQALASQSSSTSMGHDLHIGAGVGEAMQALQQQTGHVFLKDSGGFVMPCKNTGKELDRIAMVISAGPRVSTGILGLSQGGSVKAGKALIDSLPLQSVGAVTSANLRGETSMIKALVKSRPELLILVGGEDSGAEDPIKHWIEVTRTACCLLPEKAKPVVIFTGNPALESAVRRRLEPVVQLKVLPNIQPLLGEYDLVPAQSLLEGEILKKWKDSLPGLAGLHDLTRGLNGIPNRSLDRMLRFLSLAKHQNPAAQSESGVLAIDLGGKYTTLSAGLDGRAGTVIQDKFPDLGDTSRMMAAKMIRDWSSEDVTLEEADQFLCNHAVLPGWVPETHRELALSHGFAHFRIRAGLEQLSEYYPWLGYDPQKGLRAHFEPVIASGALLTRDPNPGRILLTLLNALQPWGITTMVLDRFQILPLLGKIGEAEPVLPVQVLASGAFENLGTVVSAVGDLPAEKTAVPVRVEMESGKNYTVDVLQGTLRRLIIPTGEAAVLVFRPDRRVDVGFGGPGLGGRLKVTGGLVGVVIDARGRPLRLLEPDEDRVARLQGWMRTVGGDHS